MPVWCCPPGHVSSADGSAPLWSCPFPRPRHRRVKSCWKSTTAVALKRSTSSAGWPHTWPIESKPCISLSSWWRSGALTRPTRWRCFCSPISPSRPPSSPRCLSSSPAGLSSSSWMYVAGTTTASYRRLVWHGAPPTFSRCLRASIAMATGDDQTMGLLFLQTNANVLNHSVSSSTPRLHLSLNPLLFLSLLPLSPPFRSLLSCLQ